MVPLPLWTLLGLSANQAWGRRRRGSTTPGIPGVPSVLMMCLCAWFLTICPPLLGCEPREASEARGRALWSGSKPLAPAQSRWSHHTLGEHRHSWVPARSLHFPCLSLPIRKTSRAGCAAPRKAGPQAFRGHPEGLPGAPRHLVVQAQAFPASCLRLLSKVLKAPLGPGRPPSQPGGLAAPPSPSQAGPAPPSRS